MKQTLLQKMAIKYPMITKEEISLTIKSVEYGIGMSSDGRIENYNQQLEEGVDFRLEGIKNGL